MSVKMRQEVESREDLIKGAHAKTAFWTNIQVYPKREISGSRYDSVRDFLPMIQHQKVKQVRPHMFILDPGGIRGIGQKRN